jgi:hypothetical protein
MGIPQDIVISLAKLNNSTTFVETGTFQGETTKWAANYFETVHTIERAEGLHGLHSKELSQIKGITPHLGDSRKMLPQIVEQIGAQKAVFWLDSHWSGFDTAGANDECPLIDELSCLSSRYEDIILIDDARLFLCVPPPPHNPSHWPNILDIAAIFTQSDRRPFVQIVDDVIFIIPNRVDVRNHLIAYAQKRSNVFWQEFSMLQRMKSFPPGA